MKIKVGDNNLTIRKWKGKDKKAFVKAINKKDISENEVMDTLVYSCIEENVVLSIDEFRYVLSRIRAYSLGEEIKIDFYCDECGSIHKETFQLKDIIRFSYKELKEITVNDLTISLGPIKNKKIYNKLISEDEVYDLILRIEKINGDDAFTLDSLLETFDELDVDILTEVFEIWESSKFTVEDINDVTCSCGSKSSFKFDELPGFFPTSWFK